MLVHPQSADLIEESAYKTAYSSGFRIACGTTNCENIDYSESRDFFPSYASWNSVLFETSVILTCWEHADQLFGDDNVAILHTDLSPHIKAPKIWNYVNQTLESEPDASIALTMPTAYMGQFDGMEVPDDFPLVAKNDPLLIHAFDHNVHVWDYIKKYDPDIYEFAMDENPRMIYSHQFACTRKTFDYLGQNLHNVASRMTLNDSGLWSPHIFERLLALYLAKNGRPIITAAFWHHASSGSLGPGELNLYGVRGFKFYKLNKGK